MYKPEEIINIELLSSYLRTSAELLDTFINGKKKLIDWRNKADFKNLNLQNKSEKEVHIQRFYIPKRNKKLGYRIVYKLRNQFATDILKVLKFNLYELYTPTECVHGFVLGKDTLTNAKSHVGSKLLLSLDIVDFFKSISIGQVKMAFKHLGFNDEISRILSEISTIEDSLPPGFPTSPFIANIVFRELDDQINDLCKQNRAIYTRYADDISISSDYDLPSVDDIEEILSPSGFLINSQKTKFFKRGQNQYVTGLSITDDKYPRIPKHIKKKLRQEIYHIKKFGFHSHICHLNNWDEKTDKSITEEIRGEVLNRMKGWIDYIKHIEPKVAEKFYEDFNLIIEKIRIEADKNYTGQRILGLWEFKQPIFKKK